MYVVEEGGHALLIDPCVTDLQSCNCSNVDMIIATHEHYDHISGVKHWKERTSAPFLCSASCAERCANPAKNLSRYFGAFADMQDAFVVDEQCYVDDYSCAADVVFTDKYSTVWRGHELMMESCPGHSPGSIIIGIDNRWYFTGDSLLPGYEPALRFPGGSSRRWQEQGLPLLRSLPSDAISYPGHFGEFRLHDHVTLGEQ